MRFIKRIKTKGLATMILILLIVMPMIWGLALVHSVLDQKIKNTKLSSNYQMFSNETKAQEFASSMYKHPFELEIRRRRPILENAAMNAVHSLPIAFRLALIKNAKSHIELNVEGHSPLLPKTLLESSSEVQEPPKPMRKKRWLKYSLWQESMLRAGFGVTPLLMLAVPELLDAAAAVGGGKIPIPPGVLK